MNNQKQQAACRTVRCNRTQRISFGTQLNQVQYTGLARADIKLLLY